MDWRNIKTIFIFTFLILDFYLGLQVFQKTHSGIEQVIKYELHKIEEQYDGTLPEIKDNLKLTIGERVSFKPESSGFIKKRDNQNINITSKSKIINSTLKEPVKITPYANEDDLKSQLEHFVKEYIPVGPNQYQYWKFDEARNTYLFRQVFKGHPMHFTEPMTEDNITGLIELHVNENNEIESYRQSMLKVKESEKQKLITAEEALKVTNFQEKIKKIQLVYYPIVTNANQIRLNVFVPGWYISTDHQKVIVLATNYTLINLNDKGSEVE